MYKKRGSLKEDKQASILTMLQVVLVNCFIRDTNEMKTVLYKRECFILLEKIYITFVIDNSIFGLSIMGRTFIDRWRKKFLVGGTVQKKLGKRKIGLPAENYLLVLKCLGVIEKGGRREGRLKNLFGKWRWRQVRVSLVYHKEFGILHIRSHENI